jgi:hypothetical protein
MLRFGGEPGAVSQPRARFMWQLLSCSGDCVQMWCKEVLESRGPGAMEDKPERTLLFPQGTVLRIAKVHAVFDRALIAVAAVVVRVHMRPFVARAHLFRYLRRHESESLLSPC